MSVRLFFQTPKNVVVTLRLLLFCCVAAIVYYQRVYPTEPATACTALCLLAGYNVVYWFLVPKGGFSRRFVLLSGAGFIIDMMVVTMVMVSIPSLPNKAFVLVIPYFITVLVATLCRRVAMTLIAAFAGSIGFALGAPHESSESLFSTGMSVWFALFYVSALSASYLAEQEMARRRQRRVEEEERLVRDATAAVRRILSLYELLADNIPVGMFIYDSGGKPVFCNRIMVDMVGKTYEELMREGLTADSVGSDNQKLLEERIRKALGENISSEPEEITIRRDGEEKHLLFRVLPLLSEGEEKSLALLLFEDISLAKKTEEERLRMAKVTGVLEVLMTLATHIKEETKAIEDIAVQVMEHARRVFDFSCFAFLDLSEKECRLKVYLMKPVREDFIESLKEKMVKAGDVVERRIIPDELDIRIKEMGEGGIDGAGEDSPNSYFAVPLASNREIVAILSFSSGESEKFHPEEIRFVHALVGYYSMSMAWMDAVRERMRSEAEARMAHERLMAQERLIEHLRRLDRLKSNFILTVSHQLRTPLTSIKSSAELLKDGMVGEMEGEQCECLEVIIRNVDRLVGIVNDVLDLSKLEAGKVSMRKKMQNLRPLVEEAVMNLKQLALKKGMLIESPEFEDVKAYFDYQAILQVLTNLIGNAIVHNPQGTRIRITVERKGEDFVLVSVSDTGVGIPKKEIHRIFDKFYQAERSLKSGTKGSGLGLAICKNLVEAHGGEIWVRNNPKKGVTFTFTLRSHPGRVRIKHTVNGRELLFGRIAVLLGYVKEEQLEECIGIQENLPFSTTIGELMLKKGYLNGEQVKKVLAIQEEVLREPSPKDPSHALADTLFGRIAVQYGYISRERLNECIRQQALRRNGGRDISLGELMVEKGYLTPAQVLNILRYQGAKILICRSCGMRINLYGYDEDSRYICRKCDTELAPLDEVDYVSVDGVEFDWDLRNVYKKKD